MDKTVPIGAALLLDFIGSIEAPNGYGTLFANRQNRLSKPLTSMTIDEVIAAGTVWSHWGPPGSSAAGRYQFMRDTLKGLKAELGLRGTQLFDADLQDRLGHHLLKRRSYDSFMAGTKTVTDFAKELSKEWASLPVLADTQGAHRPVKRGQSYYVGDGVNKSLVTPERVSKALNDALLATARPITVGGTGADPLPPLAAPPEAPLPIPAETFPAPERPGWGGNIAVLIIFALAVIVVCWLVWPFVMGGPTP